MTLFLAIGFPKTDGSNVKKPRPTALKDYMHRLDRVGRFTPNPALPKDQPLRGSWLDSHSFLSNLSQNTSYFIPNSHKDVARLHAI